jgi:GrpB-like predicted nucleotidyltransferase (UPF0157 family)
VLGSRPLRIKHTGSTSVPGLAAKPIIDMLLEAADSADESAYVPALKRAGYTLRIREVDWYEHRMFKGPETEINLHVFSSAFPEIDRILMFRDWLRKQFLRSRVIRTHQACTGRKGMEVRPELGRRQGRNHPGDYGTSSTATPVTKATHEQALHPECV